MAKRTGLADRSDAAKLDELLTIAEGATQRSAAIKAIHAALHRRLEKLESDVEAAEEATKRSTAAAWAEGKAELRALAGQHQAEVKAAQAAVAQAQREQAEAVKAAAKREEALQAKIDTARDRYARLQGQLDDLESKLRDVARTVDAREPLRRRHGAEDED
jgi:chromosome segregation ATPase